MQYKDGKIIQIIQEFSVLGNTYNLNGIDLDHAVFFVREDRKKFRALLPAEYKINVDGTNVNLEIQDGVLNNCISVQVGIDLNKLSDFYNPVGSPDIVVLKDKYNQLCQDMANLWEYVKKQGVSSDALNRDIVLPILKEGETYVMLNGSLEATPLVTAETELQKLLDELISKSHDILDDYVKLLTDNSKSDIQNYTEDKKTEIQDYIDENMEDFARKHDILGVLDVAYGGIFGTDLTSIEADKVYFYKNPVSGRETPYVALATKTGAFITPDVNNFKSLTNRDNLFHKKLNIVIQTSNNITLMNAYIHANLLIVNGFVSNPTNFNNAVAGTEFVNLGTMIPEIKDYAAVVEPISGMNLVFKSNFALAKSTSSIPFYNNHHFTIIAGVNQGTIR